MLNYSLSRPKNDIFSVHSELESTKDNTSLWSEQNLNAGSQNWFPNHSTKLWLSLVYIWNTAYCKQVLCTPENNTLFTWKKMPHDWNPSNDNDNFCSLVKGWNWK